MTGSVGSGAAAGLADHRGLGVLQSGALQGRLRKDRSPRRAHVFTQAVAVPVAHRIGRFPAARWLWPTDIQAGLAGLLDITTANGVSTSSRVAENSSHSVRKCRTAHSFCQSHTGCRTAGRRSCRRLDERCGDRSRSTRIIPLVPLRLATGPWTAHDVPSAEDAGAATTPPSSTPLLLSPE